ncbi:MAG: hypothetical protein ABL967_08995 [Bryobacteraceae bacterium]
MILSNETLAILKNFGSITNCLAIEPGNLVEASAQNGVLARAVVKEEFPVKIILYDVDRFLSAVGLLSQPDFFFESHFVQVTGDHGKEAVRYLYGAESLRQKPPRVPALPKETIHFELPEQKLASLLKAVDTLGRKEIRILSDGQAVQVTTYDQKNPDSSHTYSLAADAANTNGFQCTHILNVSTFKMLKGSYDVTVCPRFSVFRNTCSDLTYWIACDPTISTFY